MGAPPAPRSYLEKLLTPGNGFFTSLGPCSGDLALFAVLDLAMDNDPHCLDRFPGVKQFYANVYGLPSLQGYLANPFPQYYKRVYPKPAAEPEARPPSSAGSCLPTTDYGPGIAGRRVLQPPGGASSLTFG